MRLLEIERHLREWLPLETDYFNEWLTASVSVASGTATITTVEDHGFSAGDEITLKDVVFPNPLASLTRTAGTATAIPQYPSDLTYPFNRTVAISGADQAEYNGVMDIVSTPTRKEINFTVATTAVTPATGTIIMHESNLARYSGIFEVLTAPSAKTFTVAVSDVADFTSSCSVSALASRIAVTAHEQKAMEDYTEQELDNLWLFIIPKPCRANKSRDVDIDAEDRIDHSTEIHQQVAETFTVMVIGNATDKVTPSALIDICRNDIRNALFKTLVGYFPTTDLSSEQMGIFFVGDEPYSYSRCGYIHVYDFGLSFELSADDTFVPRSAALSGIGLRWIGTHPDNVDYDYPIAVDDIDYTS